MRLQIDRPHIRGSLFEDRKSLLIWVGAAYLFSLGLFAYFAGDMDRFPGELSVSVWVQSWQPSWLGTVMRAISAPGTGIAGIPLTALALPVLYLKGWQKESIFILAVTLLGFGVTSVIKELVARPRPPAGLVQTTGEFDSFSFPSGHVTHYMVFLGTMAALLIWNMRPSPARTLLLSCVALALLGIGVSRVYLGAHMLGDVMGGYLLGAGMVAFAVVLWRVWVNRGARASVSI